MTGCDRNKKYIPLNDDIDSTNDFVIGDFQKQVESENILAKKAIQALQNTEIKVDCGAFFPHFTV